MEHNNSSTTESFSPSNSSDLNTLMNLNDTAVNAEVRNEMNSIMSSSHGGSGEVLTNTGTTTLVVTQQETRTNEVALLRLTLRPQLHVTWDEGVINNEGLGRKSSKRCCIFHKQREFGESSTESSDDSGEDSESTSSSSSGGGGSGRARRPITRSRKKGGKPKIPDFQRFHA